MHATQLPDGRKKAGLAETREAPNVRPQLATSISPDVSQDERIARYAEARRELAANAARQPAPTPGELPEESTAASRKVGKLRRRIRGKTTPLQSRPLGVRRLRTFKKSKAT